MLRDPNDGVNYFKRFLRPHFIKGAQNVFLYRFMQFMKYNRGTMDLQKWMTRFQLTGNGLIESWMDLPSDLLITSPDASAFVAQRRQDHEAHQAEDCSSNTRTRSTCHCTMDWWTCFDSIQTYFLHIKLSHQSLKTQLHKRKHPT